MPLDAADFISQLDITSPPGTDPLNQGDDQIRTAKRTQLNSFPLVDAAVNISAAQMNQMAIKNEVNSFTADQTFVTTATFQFVAQFNSTSARCRSTNAGNNSGLLFISDIATLRWDFIRRSTNDGGDLVMQRYDGNGTFQDTPFTISATTGRALWANQSLMADGTEAAPGTAFASDSTTGMYRPGTSIGWSVAGVTAAFLLPAQFRMFLSGSAAAPAYSFQPDTNMGMYRSASNVLAFATAGVQRCTMTGTEFQYFAPIRAVDGSPSNAGFGFQAAPTLGLYRIGTTEFGMTADSAKRMSVTSRGVNMQPLPTNTLGLLSGDLWQTGGDVRIVP